MLNIAAYINPLQHAPNPTAAVGNALHARGLEYNNANEKARLAEQAREADQRDALGQGELGFRQTQHADLMAEHKQSLHTKLVEWGTKVIDQEGAEKARQIVGPVWEAAGIGVDFGDAAPGPGVAATAKEAAAPGQPGPPAEDDEMAALEAAQAKRGDLSEYAPTGDKIEREAPATGDEGMAKAAPDVGDSGIYGPKPGESFSAYVSRNTAKPKPTEKAVEAQATEGPEAAASDEAAATVAQAPKPWRIIDKSTGRVIGVIDPQKVETLNRERAKARAGAYASGTPENRRGIVEGFTGAARNTGEVETGMEHAEKEIGSLDKTDRTIKNHRGGGATVVPGLVADGVNTKLLNQLDNQARAYVSKAAQNSGVIQLQKRANELMSVDSMFESDNPAAQRQAFASILRSFSGATVSDKERKFFEQNAGFWSALNNKIQSFVGGGQMDPTLREDMRKAAAMMMSQSQELLQQLAEEAAQTVMEDPSIGGLYPDALGKRWTPEAKAAKKKTLSNVTHVDTDGSGAAGKSEADKKAEELGF